MCCRVDYSRKVELLNFHWFNICLMTWFHSAFNLPTAHMLYASWNPQIEPREGMEIWKGGREKGKISLFPFAPPPPPPHLFPSSLFLLSLGLARENPYAKVVFTSFEFFPREEAVVHRIVFTIYQKMCCRHNCASTFHAFQRCLFSREAT